MPAEFGYINQNRMNGYLGGYLPRNRRRSSSSNPVNLDQALWVDFSNINTLWQNSAGTTPVTADSDPIRRVDDLSVWGRNLIAPSNSARPTYKTGIQNGLSAALFDNTDDEFQLALTLDSLWSASAATVFAVVRRTGGVDAEMLFEHSTNISTNTVHFWAPFSDNNFYFRYGDSTSGGSLSVAAPGDWTGNTHVVELYRNGTSGTSAIIKVDNSTIASGTMTDTLDSLTSTATFTLGNTTLVPTSYFSGYIMEFMIFNYAITAGNETAIFNYLKNKWGTP